MENRFWTIGVWVSAVILGINAPLHADSTQKQNSLDDISMIAVEQTKQLLNNPQIRNSELAQDPAAQKAISNLKSMAFQNKAKKALLL